MRSPYLTLGIGVVLGATLSYGIFTRDASTRRALDARGTDTAKAAERAELDVEPHRDRPRAEPWSQAPQVVPSATRPRPPRLWLRRTNGTGPRRAYRRRSSATLRGLI